MKAFFLVLILLQSCASQQEGQQCSICKDPSIGVSLPSVAVLVPPFGTLSCADLEVLVPLLVPLEDERCTLIQSLGTLCGCPPPVEGLQNPCHLCVPVSEAAASVPEEWLSAPVEFFGQAATCQLAELSLKNTFEASSSECRENQAALSSSCGCAATDTDPPPNVPELPTEVEKCTPCWDGSSDITLPDKDVGSMLINLGIPISGNVTCSAASAVVFSTLEATNPDCNLLQITIGGLCGCPRRPDGCNMCEGDAQVPYPDKVNTPSGVWFQEIPTCQESYMMLWQLPKDKNAPSAMALRNSLGLPRRTDVCRTASSSAYVCGCYGGQRQYMGATSDAKRAFLAWLPRVTGSLSLIGSVCILWDVFVGQKRKGRSNTSTPTSIYHGLVAGLSIFDIFSSSVWIASTAPVSKTFYRSFGSWDSTVYGAIGNEATCKAQGFFMELGVIGSISYNLVLCIYYMLVIVYGKRQDSLKKLRLWFHAPVIVTAFAFAGSGIPKYAFSLTVCTVAAPPAQDTYLLPVVYILGPLAIVHVVVTAIMVNIYVSVRRTTRKAQRWNFQANPSHGHSSTEASQQSSATASILAHLRSSRTSRNSATTGFSNQMEKEVFWQCLFFLLAFYLTWPFYFLAQFFTTSESYAFWVMVAIFSPLQGFFNALVYARPRIVKRLREQRQRERIARLKTQQPEPIPSLTSTNDPDEDGTSRKTLEPSQVFNNLQVPVIVEEAPGEQMEEARASALEDGTQYESTYR